MSKQKINDSLLIELKNTKIDTSKCLILNQISNSYLYSNFDKGLIYAKRALNLANKIKWSKGIGLANTNIARHVISKGDFEDASKYLEIAESIFKKTKDEYNLANVYNQFGILNANKGKFPEALDYFFKSIQNFESCNHENKELNIANLYQNIANIYSATEDDEKAIVNYNKAIQLFRKLELQEISLAMNIASKGTVYQKQGKYSEAISALQQAEKILKEKNEIFPLAFVTSWLGSAYLEIENFDLSLKYSQEALETITVMGDQVLMAATIQNMGAAYLKRGIAKESENDLERSFENLSSSVAMNEKSGNLELLQKDYKLLSEFYDFKNDYKKSLEFYKKFSQCSEQLYNTKSKQTLKNLEDERTIELNKKEILLNKITLKNKEKQKWYLISGLALLALIGGLLYFQNKNRKKTNEKLQVLNAELDEANKAKTRFFSILNHDLRGPVANLILFLQMQKENPDLLDEESKERIQDKTILGAENLLISMEDMLQWSKSQMENFKPQPNFLLVSQLFSDIQLHFSSVDRIKFNFIDEQQVQLYTDDNYLKTIMRNLTGNAIKALEGLENPTIEWKAWQENKKTFLSIFDNGKGATNEQLKALYDDKESVGIKSGLGLHLIRDLAKAIDCAIQVDSKPNQGTTFVLELANENIPNV